MSIKCEVVKDLLPLYVDGVASEESCALIEEHLKECEDCRQYLELLQEDLPNVSEVSLADETASLRKIKRRIRRNRVLVVLVTMVFAVIAGLLIHSQHLSEYTGTLEENLSYELPAGYEFLEPQTDSNVDRASYVRKTDKTQETITIYYDGLYESENNYYMEEPFSIDEDTRGGITRYDWDHGYDNSMDFTVFHGNETYTVQYQCQETDKNYYYDSCSKKQEEEIMAFVETFDYHRPDGTDLNVFQRLYRNLGVGGLILLALTLLFFFGVPIVLAVSGMTIYDSYKDDADRAISSKDLHASMNREREARGEASLPAINNVQGASSNTLARRDHSWSSVPDFFIKMIRRKK
ncbi:MAG: zf-HC2 domain-containing protein [Firmicutes bacterium]|nr:zf-HC2 domain-containing protein [Bacillota bacterium]